MPRWTKSELQAYETRRQSRGAKPERTIRNDAFCKGQAPQADSRRRLVRVVSYRCRLLDPDNLCAKYHIDGLRYAGLIRNDSQSDIVLELSQQKVTTKAEERTEIEIL